MGTVNQRSGRDPETSRSSNGEAALPVSPDLPDEETVEHASEVMGAIRASVASVLHGKRSVIDLVLIAVLAEGHVLIEDVPGVGKTLLAKAVAKSIGGDTRRVQGTPDLLPGDLTGVSIFEKNTGEFRFRPGPLFSNLVLCDEINRATPKAQSALLEAMEERTISVDGTTYRLPRPWMVIATQNPIDQSGTHPLPESQLDRFLIRTQIGYPAREDELAVAAPRRDGDHAASISAVTDPSTVSHLVAVTRGVHIAASLRGYAVDVVRASREHRSVRVGVSPRGLQAWIRASQARAIMTGRSYVTPDDLQAVAHATLAHRVIGGSARHGASAGSEIIDDCLAHVSVPTRRPAGAR
jgi:MoxR-like ATPase